MISALAFGFAGGLISGSIAGYAAVYGFFKGVADDDFNPNLHWKLQKHDELLKEINSDLLQLRRDVYELMTAAIYEPR